MPHNPADRQASQPDPINGVGAYSPSAWLSERLPELDGIWPLLPGAPNKMPTVGKNWPEHAGLAIAQLQHLSPTCTCWHVGADGNLHIAIDLDGKRVIAFCLKHGLDPLNADTWRIVRTSIQDRLKLVFRVTPEQKAVFNAGVKTVRVGAGELGDADIGEELAVFSKPGHQIVVLGAHFTKESNYTEQDDMYAWAGRPPAEAAFLPDDWYQFLQGVFCGEQPLAPPKRRAIAARPAAPRSKKSGGSSDWLSSDVQRPCPICGRTHSGACSVNRDGNSVWCNHGVTCSAPDCATPGEIHHGRDGRSYGYVRTELHEPFGERSLFVLHTERIDYSQPSPDWCWQEDMTGMQPPARAALTGASTTLPYAGSAYPSQGNVAPVVDQEDAEAVAEAIADLRRAGELRITLDDVLPKCLAEPLARRAAAFPADPLSLLLPLLVTASGVIGRRLTVKVKDGWEDHMILWGANIAQPGSMKSQQAKVMGGPLRRWQQSLKKSASEKEKAWEREHAQAKAEREKWKRNENTEKPEVDPLVAFLSENPKPASRRVVIGDATVERIGQYFTDAETHGLVCFLDELSPWFSRLQRNGKDGNDDTGMWCELYDTGFIDTGRTSREDVYIPDCGVAVFGPIQPDKMIAARDAAAKTSNGNPDGSGIFGRFLLYVPSRDRWRFTPLEVDISDLIRNLLERQIDAAIPPMKVSSDGANLIPTPIRFEHKALMEVIVPHQEALADLEAASGGGERGQWLDKGRGRVLRIAGVLHVLTQAVRNPSGITHPISRETCERAVLLNRWCLAQYDLAMAELGVEHDALPAEVRKLLAKGIEWRKVHGSAPVTNRTVWKEWRLPQRGTKAQDCQKWLLSVIGEDRAGPMGWIERTPRSVQWHPPAG